jgi:hypothetical protein
LEYITKTEIKKKKGGVVSNDQLTTHRANVGQMPTNYRGVPLLLPLELLLLPCE